MAGPLQLTFVNYKKDSYIVVEGKSSADRFYIIRQGRVRISKDVEVVQEEGGNTLGPGDFFGVVSSMSSHSQIETAKALTDVTLISVMKEQYGQLIQNNTSVAMKIIFQFSKRMRYLDEALTKLTLKNNAEEDPSHLFKVAEYYTRQSQYNQAYYAYHQYLKYCPAGEAVMQARERMMKIAPYAKAVKLKHGTDELVRVYPKDSMIFSEGEPGEELFIIKKGSVKIAKIVDNNEVLLAVLKTGDIFGEMALLESKPRAACAVAYEECQVMTVNRKNFETMVSSQPQIVSRLTTLLAERIWFIYKQLANTLINDPMGRIYDALLIQLEKNRVDVNGGQYTFDFGPKELVNMVGIPQKEGALVLRKLMENSKIQIIKDRDKEKIHSMELADIARQTEYYRKMQRIERLRRENTMWNIMR
ncbi:MAG: cyclic nucleotide-binding domain-containing protein [Treponema sp.]|nr:cyclic nucleotide-binding domain-containing protein [Treponema sp.]